MQATVQGPVTTIGRVRRRCMPRMGEGYGVFAGKQWPAALAMPAIAAQSRASPDWALDAIRQPGGMGWRRAAWSNAVAYDG